MTALGNPLSLIKYCSENNISIDEVFLGKPIFSEKRCEACKMRAQCSMYEKVKKFPVTINEIEGKEINIEIKTEEKEQFLCIVYKGGNETSRFSLDGKQIDKVIITLQRK